MQQRLGLLDLVLEGGSMAPPASAVRVVGFVDQLHPSRMWFLYFW